MKVNTTEKERPVWRRQGNQQSKNTRIITILFEKEGKHSAFNDSNQNRKRSVGEAQLLVASASFAEGNV